MSPLVNPTLRTWRRTPHSPEHFAVPRISALFCRSTRRCKRLHWQQFTDRLASPGRTFVKSAGLATITFQLEMFFDGRISITYLDAPATGPIVGLSSGKGWQPDLPFR